MAKNRKPKATSIVAHSALLEGAPELPSNVSDEFQEEANDFCADSSPFYDGDYSNRSSRFSGDVEGRAKEPVDGAKELRDTFIRNEERAVRKSRILVGLAILLCSIAVSISVYLIAESNDYQSFELDYKGIVTDIKALVRWEVRYNFALMEQLSAQITIDAGYLNSTFPFHTEPHFEITGGFVDGMGGIMSTAFAPFVMEEQRDEWGVYVRQKQGWIEESAYLKAVHPGHRDSLHGTIQDHEHDRLRRRLAEATDAPQPKPSVSRTIYRWENGGKVPEINQPGQLYAPLWQVIPADYGAVNANLLSDVSIARLYLAMLKANTGVLSSNFEVGDYFDFLFDPEEKYMKKDPHGFILQPVYDAIIEPANQTLVGFLIAITPFGNLLDRLVPEGKHGIVGVFKDDCGNVMSFELSSKKAKFLGYEDFHEPHYDAYQHVETNLEMYKERLEGVCTHDLYLYPSSVFEDAYHTNRPYMYASLVAAAFLVVIGLFVLYDWTITRRQNKTIHTALKSQAIITSLFPAEMGRQMINEANQAPANNQNNAFSADGVRASMASGHFTHEAAMAQLYPAATVMFADLVGFTAWSSMRDPPQVFRLLETIYSSFDEIANRRGVFKVETIGDCYVAVCGLPQKRKNHHVVMARFAHDCSRALGPLLQKLCKELGPDTEELGIRVGLNSGPVTAGVLRADRARFQLFGDTVNTAARMESTGAKNKIQISRDTADLLIANGKGHWTVPRNEVVVAKGKGELETFWLVVKNETSSAISGFSGHSNTIDQSSLHEASTPPRKQTKVGLLSSQKEKIVVDPKTQRLVDWNTDILLRSLRDILCHRQAAKAFPDSVQVLRASEDKIQNSGILIFDELPDVVSMPKYDFDTHHRAKDCQPEIDQVVIEQLKDYVRVVAGMYRNNSFHCFEHASHVTMSVNKLMNRIVQPNHEEQNDIGGEHLHYYTHGLTSDPLTQFAIVLAALIHDVDHYGVPNALLVKEGAPIATTYKGKSVAEQNSLALAWKTLMQDSYRDLRHAIYCNKNELHRFRQILLVTVMATDIADQELKEKRNVRWNKAFNSTAAKLGSEFQKEDIDRKATIVIEHIIQASDISHTMQHWHIYRKWNERLFMEMYDAYKSGRTETNPSTFWYKGEIGFFDFYIIPLAKKLKECGVFGVSSDEYLNYAVKNREEWEKKGMQAVADYVAKVTDLD